MRHYVMLCMMVAAVNVMAAEEGVKVFQDPAEVSEDFLNGPYDMDVADDGRIFVADRRSFRIMVWNADGTYGYAFGSKGEGPGEFAVIERLRITDDRLYVYDTSSKISIFQLDGTFERAFRYEKQLRTFAALNPNLFLVMYRKSEGPSDIRIHWELIDGNGESVRVLMSEPESLFVGRMGEENEGNVKIYAGEGEIQEAPDGTFYFGYGSKPVLHHIDRKGNLLGKVKFDVKTAPPNDRDKDFVGNMTMPVGGGRRLGFKDFPGIKVHYNHDKDYYTQFSIQGDHAVLVLTPLGGLGGVGIGFYDADYVVCDLKTGKAIYRGHYQFSEDSMVLFNKGKALGFLVDEETDEFTMSTLHLKGLPTN